MADGKAIRLRIQPTEEEISPLIFGHFIEFIENCIMGGVYDPGSPSSDKDGIRQDVLELAKGLHPTILRWPGGTYANIYHWMDAVGPMSERKKRKNLIWGGITDGVFGTAEFVTYCRALGAEPMLCVNMASGTAEEAANWVEYCNGEPGTYYADLRVAQGYPEPFHVKYWCIGNESNAEPDLGAQHVPERYISDAWEFTKHMKLTDPTIKLVFVGTTHDWAWNKKILDSLHPVCDYFSVHHYSGGDGTYGPFGALRNFRQSLDRLIPFLKEYSDRDQPFNKWYRFPRRADAIKLAVDEWNIWNSTPRGENNRYGVKMIYNWRDALWTAGIMNTFVHYAENIGITNLAQMVNVLAPIVTDGDRSFVQTTYPVLKLYRDGLSGKRADCLFDSPVFDAEGSGSMNALDAAACVREDGSVCLFVSNLTENRDYEITLPEEYRAEEWIRLRADSFDEVNSPEHNAVRCESCDVSRSIVLPAGSVNRVTMRRASCVTAAETARKR